MKTLDEIKQMMAASDTAQADAALKELLAKEPDNLQAKMLHGTCRQLLGDEETFKRIHDELAPVMEKQVKEEPKAEAVSLWKKYQALWMSLIVGGLVLAGVGMAAKYFNAIVHDVDISEAIKGRSNEAVNIRYDPAMAIATCCPLSKFLDRQKDQEAKEIEKQTKFSDIKNGK